MPVVYNTGLCERLRFQKNLGLLLMSMCLSCIIQGYVSVLDFRRTSTSLVLSMCLSCIIQGWQVYASGDQGLCERLKIQKKGVGK